MTMLIQKIRHINSPKAEVQQKCATAGGKFSGVGDINRSEQRQNNTNNQKQFDLQDAMTDPVAFIASNDPDDMYYHKAMRSKDSNEFVKAWDEGIKDHEDFGHWKVISKKRSPTNTKLIDMIWSMRRKRRLDTGVIYKLLKSRLNVHGRQYCLPPRW